MISVSQLGITLVSQNVISCHTISYGRGVKPSIIGSILMLLGITIRGNKLVVSILPLLFFCLLSDS